MRRRDLLGGAVGALLTAGVLGSTSACGSSGPSGGGGGDQLQLWALQDAQYVRVVQPAIDTFNAGAKAKVRFSGFVNDAYKQKLQVSMGSPQAPDIFFNWGGGNLAQFVDAKQVVDLTDRTAGLAGDFLPSVLSVGQVAGRQYALPMNGIQPVIFFYHKAVFAKAGLQPPRTWDELLSVVDAFKARGVTPIALPGSQGWTELMYLEYLLDRVGGPDKFAAVAAGKPGAWSDPAMLKAVTMCQDLAERGAFGTNFASVNYDNTGASRLFATGKAAMFLMGSWEYATQLTNNPTFIKGGQLGWLPFPSVPGGAGDPAAVVGNPSNYYSVSAGSKHADVAVDFLTRTLTSESYVKALIDVGQVPAVKGVEAKLAGTPGADFTTFTYQLVSKAPSFTQSWDQALSPSVGAELLTNLQKLFLAKLSPAQFVAAMGTAR
ncbi:extracellular solute-binding protein [Micromonospora sp. R77]|uniref:ABC transporter substrate-binding protein n=1 Tax=Micromonospora sp. R77 TaxID=2925836 RepID=UPI001F613E16|nr:extracellular solute-binding protein [Micromonospora sp. R77]MCI4065912.1 extracellular solute-binding protein [Micromonospora sp. R77]